MSPGFSGSLRVIHEKNSPARFNNDVESPIPDRQIGFAEDVPETFLFPIDRNFHALHLSERLNPTIAVRLPYLLSKTNTFLALSAASVL